jgi:type 1 glutamine amidotransferase
MKKSVFRFLWAIPAWAATACLAVSAAESPDLRPLLQSRAEIEAVLAQAPPAPLASGLRPLEIVLVADEKDHGPNEHDYPLWQKRWKVLLGGMEGQDAETQVNLYGAPAPGDPKVLSAGTPKVKVTTAWQWPSPEQLRAADLIVMYCYRSGGGHWLWNEERPKDVEAFLSRGGGFVVIHAATYMHVDMAQPQWKPLVELTGLALGKGNRTRRGPMEIRLAADHTIYRGLPKIIRWVDEPFWPAFGDQSAVEVLGTSAETVAVNSTESKPQPMFWTYSRGKGRVFGCVPGHFTWTFDDPYFRLLLLRGMAWAAKESPCRFDSLVLRGVSFCDESGKKPPG